jgi:hypothetical protein
VLLIDVCYALSIAKMHPIYFFSSFNFFFLGFVSMALGNNYIGICLNMISKLPCDSVIAFSNWQCQICSWLEFANYVASLQFLSTVHSCKWETYMFEYLMKGLIITRKWKEQKRIKQNMPFPSLG